MEDREIPYQFTALTLKHCDTLRLWLPASCGRKQSDTTEWVSAAQPECCLSSLPRLVTRSSLHLSQAPSQHLCSHTTPSLSRQLVTSVVCSLQAHTAGTGQQGNHMRRGRARKLCTFYHTVTDYLPGRTELNIISLSFVGHFCILPSRVTVPFLQRPETRLATEAPCLRYEQRINRNK